MDGATAIVGYLMFGNLRKWSEEKSLHGLIFPEDVFIKITSDRKIAVKDELTTNVLTTTGYPKGLNIFLLVLVAIVPITKFPLWSVNVRNAYGRG